MSAVILDTVLPEVRGRRCLSRWLTEFFSTRRRSTKTVRAMVEMPTDTATLMELPIRFRHLHERLAVVIEELTIRDLITCQPARITTCLWTFAET